MMATLREVAKRSAPIVVFNPLKERALERFASPQSPVEMATLGSTPIASDYLQVRIGGDIAALKGVMKAVFALDDADIAAGGTGVLDREFIAEHTTGFEALRDDVMACDWVEIEAASGLKRADLEHAAQIYVAAPSVIVCYGMGITQHRQGTAAGCSRSATCCCCVAISAGPAAAFARCAAIPMSRATARSGWMREGAGPPCWPGSRKSTASIRRPPMATTPSRPSRRCATAARRSCCVSAATWPSPCPIRRKPSRRCAISTWPSTSPPSPTARTCCWQKDNIPAALSWPHRNRHAGDGVRSR